MKKTKGTFKVSSSEIYRFLVNYRIKRRDYLGTLKVDVMFFDIGVARNLYSSFEKLG